MTFTDVYNRNSWESLAQWIYSASATDVERALSRGSKRTLHDFAALLSPEAASYLSEMVALSTSITRRRFGNVVQMYIPMYLSNECQNICTYCGFSFTNKTPRITLTERQILQEIEVIKSYGYDHILLLTGEHQSHVGMDYFERAIKLVRPHFSYISIEVQPLAEDEYKRLADLGVSAVLVYQETYHQENYARYHPKGKKSNFIFRLETADRIGSAGIHKIGIGTLIGLSDWRIDSLFTTLHLEYLKKRYWRSKYTISFPRLRPAAGCANPQNFISDQELIQLICAYRIFDEDVELSLSTREAPAFRDQLMSLGITSVSAGSKTQPGGYALGRAELAQFEVSDDRTPAEVARMIKAQGLEPVWKDWDVSFR